MVIVYPIPSFPLFSMPQFLYSFSFMVWDLIILFWDYRSYKEVIALDQ